MKKALVSTSLATKTNQPTIVAKTGRYTKKDINRALLQERLAKPLVDVHSLFHQSERNISNDATGSIQRIFAILQWPALTRIANALAPQKEGTRGSIYPAGLLLALSCWAIEVGSRDEVEAQLRYKELWGDVQRIWFKQTSQVLPSTPPGVNHIDTFYARVRAYTESSQGMWDGMDQFRKEAIDQVRLLGGLNPYAPFDPISTSWNNRVYGDGTYVAPNSSVQRIPIYIDENGEVIFECLKSRATSTGKQAQGPRVQSVRTAAHKDGKETTATGINFVNFLWRSTTEGERVVVDVVPVFGWEGSVAIPMIIKLCEATDGAVHSVIWDMIIANRGDQVTPFTGAVLITKTKTQPKKSKEDGKKIGVEDRPTFEALTLTFKRELKAWRAGMKRTNVWKTLTDTDRNHSELHFLNDLWCEQALSRTSEPGVSVRVRSGGLQVRTSDIRNIGEVDCKQGVAPCMHTLAWEDGALVELVWNGKKWLRKQIGKIGGVTRQLGANNFWSITGCWNLQCDLGSWPATSTWDPRQGTGTINPTDTISGWNGYVLSELDSELFRQVHGIRNDVESYHQWLARRLRFDRANTLNADDQWLDLLVMAITNNATTYGLHHGLISGVNQGERKVVRSQRSSKAIAAAPTEKP
jgi:hypothetical protein